MRLHAALAAAATLVSLAFALSTLERWLARRKPNEAAWTVSLLMFALASAALWVGSALGWSGWSYRLFFAFGAVLNVPFLALGTVYLLAPRRAADITAAVTTVLAAFAAGVVAAAPFVAPLPADTLPRGSEVFGAGPRVAAAIASGLPALVIFGGALWSAWRLARSSRRNASRRAPAGGLSPARLALANGFIAVGTLILSAGGVFNSVLDEMDAFAISLVAGITVIFVGFLITTVPSSSAPVAEWHLSPELAAKLADAASTRAASVGDRTFSEPANEPSNN